MRMHLQAPPAPRACPSVHDQGKGSAASGLTNLLALRLEAQAFKLFVDHGLESL
jgi:hypothetical protein